MSTIGPAFTKLTLASGTWFEESPRTWRAASIDQAEAVHVALGQVAAAGVEGQLPVGAIRFS